MTLSNKDRAEMAESYTERLWKQNKRLLAKIDRLRIGNEAIKAALREAEKELAYVRGEYAQMLEVNNTERDRLTNQLAAAIGANARMERFIDRVNSVSREREEYVAIRDLTEEFYSGENF